MGRASSIKRLPPQIRETIADLRGHGRTIDEILAKLRELDAGDVSRSALGRHVKQLDAIGAEIRRSRTIAEALVTRFGDADEGRVARLNIELMHGLLMRLMVGEEGEMVQLDAKEAMFVATSLQKLASAAKDDFEKEAKIRKAVAAQAADAMEDAARAAGLSAETVGDIKARILGVGK